MADPGLVMQQAVVALAVVAACVYVVRRQFPQALRRVRLRLVLVLLRPHRAAWLQRLGRRLAPAPATGPVGAACGQSESCGGCSPG